MLTASFSLTPCDVYPVFNVVKLTRAPSDPILGRQPKHPPPPEIIDDEEEYLVEEVLNSRMFRRRLQFLIKWEGYGVEHNTWEYASDVHASDLVKEYYRKHPAAPRQIRSAMFASIPFRPVSTTALGRSSLEGGVV